MKKVNIFNIQPRKIVVEDAPMFTEVAKLKDGKSFGELALIQNKPRAATIKCVQDSHFAVLDKAVYN